MHKMSVGVKWRKTKQTMSCNNQRAESSSQKKMIPQRRKALHGTGSQCVKSTPLLPTQSQHPCWAGWCKRVRAITFCKNCHCVQEWLIALPPRVQSKPLEQQPMRSTTLAGLSLPRLSRLQCDLHETVQPMRPKSAHQFPGSSSGLGLSSHRIKIGLKP